MDRENWIWGLSLIALTVAIHTAGVVLMALAGYRTRQPLEALNLSLWRGILIVVGVVSCAGLLLAVLHGIEAEIWAAGYVWLGASKSSSDAILYSLDSMTTRGAAEITLEPNRLIIGALEAADGMLLFGISTAFLFAVMQIYWPMLAKHVAPRHPPQS